MRSLGAWLAIVLVLFSSLARAEELTGKISGTVADAVTRHPLPFTNVTVVGAGRGAVTDGDGYYSIADIPPGSYTIEARTIGYERGIARDIRVSARSTTIVNFSLEVRILPTEDWGHRPLNRYFDEHWWDTRGSAVVWKLKSQRPERVRVSALQQTFDVLPGVVWEKDGLHVRGGRPTDIAWEIDGASVNGPLYGDRAIWVPLSALDRVIVTTVTSETEAGNSETCDIIPAWPSGHFSGGATISSGVPDADEEDPSYDGDLWLRSPGLGRRLPLIFCSAQASRSPSRFVPSLLDKNERTGFLDLSWFASGNHRLRLNATGSIREYDQYDHRWKYNPSGLPHCAEKNHLSTLAWSHTILRGCAYYKLRAGNLTVARDAKVNEKDWEDYARPSSDPYGEIPPHFFTSGDYPLHHRSRESTYFGEAFLSAVVRQANQTDQIETGIEVTRCRLDLDRKELSGTLLNQIDYSHKPSSFAFHLRDKIERPGMVLTIGTRLECLNADSPGSQTKLSLLPRLGVCFPITGEGKIFFSYGRFAGMPPFRFLRPERLGWQDSSEVFGNPDLGFEKTATYQVGAQRLLFRRLLASVSIFRREGRDLLAVVSRPGWWQNYYTFSNAGSLDSHGLECLVEAAYWKYLRGELNYTYSIARGGELETNTWDELFYYRQLDNPHPSWDRRHSASGDVFLEFEKRKGTVRGGEIGISGRYSSGFPYYVDEDEYISSPYLVLNSLTRVDFTILGIKESIFLSVLNLLDRKNVLDVDEVTGEPGGAYGDPTHWGEGRRVVLGASVQW